MNYLTNHIVFNSKNKRLFFKIQINKKMIFFLKIFKKHNLISSYYVFNSQKKNGLKKTYCFVLPSYNKKLNINFFFKSFYLKNRRIQISLKALELVKKRTGNSTYLLSTSKGIIDHFSALELKKTGFIVGIIHS